MPPVQCNECGNAYDARAHSFCPRCGAKASDLPAGDVVECSECHGVYDSGDNAFCPRCGSTRGEGPVPGASDRAARLDPRRRRLRMVGVFLMVVGLLAVAQAVLLVAAPPSPDAQAIESLAGTPWLVGGPGGQLTVTVSDGGTPVPDAQVTIRYWNGSLMAQGVSGPTGEAKHLLAAPLANVTVEARGSAWLRHVYVPAGSTLRLDIDTGASPAEAWESAPTDRLMRVLGGFLLFFAAIVVAGGVAAYRARGYPLALAGVLLATAFWVLMGLAAPSAWTLVAALAFVLATVVVVRGRALFRGASPEAQPPPPPPSP